MTEVTQYLPIKVRLYTWHKEWEWEIKM